MILRTLKSKDVEGMFEWMHDPTVQQYFQRPMNKQSKCDILSFIESNEIDIGNIKSNVLSRDNNDLHFAVVDDYDDYCGTISLKNINFNNLNAEYAISMRKKTHGTGLALEATSELLKVAFIDLGLRKVYLNVLESNKRAVSFYEKVGFRLEGKARDHIIIGEKYETLLWYSIFREEFL